MDGMQISCYNNKNTTVHKYNICLIPEHKYNICLFPEQLEITYVSFPSNEKTHC